ncbi:MAG TPA: hypothetical protein DCY35_06245 [Prolixibacteraceae bacterium]|nr:hypothetical protein [Prolixibacteraceae bacterium]
MSNKKVMDIPIKKWIHVKAMAKIGDDADGLFDVEITIEGEETKYFHNNKSPSAKIENLSYLQLSSSAAEQTTAYLDNLKIYQRLTGEPEPKEIPNLVN